MTSENSPLKCASIDLELEVIKRFRCFAPLLNPKCQVFRELKGACTVLCLDFKACPQELNINKEEWQEFAKLLLHSSHYLGLANSLVFKNGDHLHSWMTLDQMRYFGEFFDPD